MTKKVNRLITPYFRTWIFPICLCLAWVSLLAALHVRICRLEDEHTVQVARMQAQTLYKTMVDIRTWNSIHGGVWVPESEWAAPNPWLPDNERILEAGEARLVKVNPAYMTRQIAELTGGEHTLFRISSHSPVRPENLADPWEMQALQSIETSRDLAEVFELWFDGSGQYFRYMAPLRAEALCLGCHHDVCLGDLRGGISVNMAAESALQAANLRKRANAQVFLFLGVLGVMGIGGASWQISRSRIHAENANRAKTAFLAHLSHDMRTPLSGAVAILQRHENEGGNQLRLVRLSLSSLLSSVHDIMDRALFEERGGQDGSQPFSLAAALNSCLDAVRPACQDKGLELRSEIDAGIPEVLLGDAYRIRQVVGNLLGNAIKFTATGQVCLRANCIMQPHQLCDVSIEVQDSGPGIAPLEADLIFERFTRGGADVPGNGLGLAIARQVARGMGGDVCLIPSQDDDGRQEVGARFLFAFSLRLGSALSTAAQLPQNERFSKYRLFSEKAALAAFAGDQAFMLNICRIFLEEMAGKKADIEKAWTNGVLDEALFNVHALKNSAAALHCERLAQVGITLENRLRRVIYDQARDIDLEGAFVDWRTCLAQTKSALDDFLRKTGG